MSGSNYYHNVHLNSSTFPCKFEKETTIKFKAITLHKKTLLVTSSVEISVCLHSGTNVGYPMSSEGCKVNSRAGIQYLTGTGGETAPFRLSICLRMSPTLPNLDFVNFELGAANLVRAETTAASTNVAVCFNKSHQFEWFQFELLN